MSSKSFNPFHEPGMVRSNLIDLPPLCTDHALLIGLMSSKYLNHFYEPERVRSNLIDLSPLCTDPALLIGIMNSAHEPFLGMGKMLKVELLEALSPIFTIHKIGKSLISLLIKFHLSKGGKFISPLDVIPSRLPCCQPQGWRSWKNLSRNLELLLLENVDLTTRQGRWFEMSTY